MDPIEVDAEIMSIRYLPNDEPDTNQCIIRVRIPGEERARLMRFTPNPNHRPYDRIRVRLQPRQTIAMDFIEVL